jgi:hypothetical protein
MARQQVQAPPAHEAPQVNGRVQLVYEADRRAAEESAERVVLTTRVEDVRPGTGPHARFVLAAPVDSTEAPRPDPHVVCQLEWTSERGLWGVPTRYAGLELGPHDTRFWLLDQIGGPVRSQRRQYVRVEWAVPLAVVVQLPPDAPAGDSVEEPVKPLLGRTRDISEGGVACFLDAPVIAAGTQVRVVLGVADDPVAADGRVLSSKPSDTEGVSLTVIAFSDPATIGDVLRPLLFEEQRRMRRLAMA